MKVAHHAAYFVWFELARSEYCRSRGLDYSRIEAEGLFMPIVEARCRYRLPARYDDLLTIRAEITARTRRTLQLHYKVHREGVLIAEAETLQMLVGLDGRPRVFPPEIAAGFDAKGSQLSTWE